MTVNSIRDIAGNVTIFSNKHYDGQRLSDTDPTSLTATYFAAAINDGMLAALFAFAD